MKNIKVTLMIAAVAFLGSDVSWAAKKTPYAKTKHTSDVSEHEADRRSMLLATGEDKIVDLDFDVSGEAGAISVGNPKIVHTTRVKMGDKYQVVFKPLSAGDTTVTVRDPEGTPRVIFRVKVAGSNLLTMASEIRLLLRDIEGVDIKIVGKKIIIDGEVIVPSDYGRVVAVAESKKSPYSGVVLNLASLSPMAIQSLAKRIQQDVNVFAPNVTTRVVNGVIFLEGTVDRETDAKRAEQTAWFYLPEIRPASLLEKEDPTAQRAAGGEGGPFQRRAILNRIVVNVPAPKRDDKMVRLVVHFVELAKDYDRIFGFKWQPGFATEPQVTLGQSSTGFGASSSNSFTATINRLFPKLQSAQTAGFARVLKTSTVTVRSQKEARVLENTAFPFQKIDERGAVTFDNANVKTEVAITPELIGSSEDILLNISATQDNVVGRAPAANAPPVVASHQVKTSLYVKSLESAAILGFQSSTNSTQFNKDDPGAGAPSLDNGFVLPPLLRSKQYGKKKSEFVIFVTPQIVENASDDTDHLKRNFRVKVK